MQEATYNPWNRCMYKRLFAVFILMLASLDGLAATEYHGFQIDDHLLGADQKADLSPAVLSSIYEQLNIVESVGLPPAVLASFKQTKLLVDPSIRGNPGVFSVQAGEGAVRIRPIVFPANKPILLHELLHAYHYQVLTMGNQQIQTAYRQAKGSALFPEEFQSAHFLANPKEYFAVTGTLYLFGDIQQPPFRCDVLAKLGEDYRAFLAAQFGPHECKSHPAGAQP